MIDPSFLNIAMLSYCYYFSRLIKLLSLLIRASSIALDMYPLSSTKVRQSRRRGRIKAVMPKMRARLLLVHSAQVEVIAATASFPPSRATYLMVSKAAKDSSRYPSMSILTTVILISIPRYLLDLTPNALQPYFLIFLRATFLVDLYKIH